MMKTILFLMMGGSGTRLGASIPKQFLEVNGLPIYQFILNLYNQSDLVDRVVVVNNEKWNEKVREQLSSESYKFPIEIVSGGTTRSESIRNAVRFVNQNYQDDANVLIHDTTHPYLDTGATERLLKLLESGNSAATLVTHVWDTVYLCEQEGITETLKRQNIGVGASPEGFSLSFLKEAFLNEAIDINRFTSVGNYAQSLGKKIPIVWSSKINLKITYPDDLAIFQESINYFSNQKDF